MSLITESERSASGTFIVGGSSAVQDDVLPCTIMIYAKPTAAGGGNLAYMFSKCNSSGQNGPRALIDDNGGAPRPLFGLSTAGITSPSKAGAANSTPYGSWSNICMTCSATPGQSNTPASTIDIYVNKVLSTPTTTTDGTGTLDSDAANDVYLLNRVGLNRHFVGDIAYWARWNRVLSGAEITSACDNGPRSVPSGLVEFWVNRTDFGPNGITYSSRTTFVAGDVPPNTAIGDDTTAPTLSSPTSSATGSTTGSGGITTNEGNGTLYAVCTTSATAPTGAQVRAGQNHTGAAAPYSSNQAVSSAGAKTFNATGLSASTTYYWHFQHRDASLNDSTVASSASFTTSAGGDVTPPTLSSPTGTQTGSTTGTGGATTNEANGTMYVVASTSATAPSAAQVKAGLMHTGAAAAASANAVVSSTGAKSVNFTGLTPSTTYYAHTMHEDASANQSSVVSSASFTTAAASAPRTAYFHTLIGRSSNV